GGREGQGCRDAGRTTCCVSRYDADLRGRRQRVAAVHVAPVPCGWDRPAARATLHVSRPPLPERRPRNRRECRDDARRALRLRRDRRRRARPQPHDGEFAPGMLCVRTPRGQGRRGESEAMSTITITDLEAAVEDAAAY